MWKGRTGTRGQGASRLGDVKTWELGTLGRRELEMWGLVDKAMHFVQQYQR